MMTYKLNNSEISVQGSIKPSNATHIAVNKKTGYKNFFCYQEDGSFWALIEEENKRPFQIVGSYCSLAPVCFNFYLIDPTMENL